VIERPRIPKLEHAPASSATKTMRPVHFNGAFRDTPIYRRESLPPGMRLDGPSVIEEFGSTTVVFPGQSLEVDPHGILIIRRGRTSPEAMR
jgi:N-methylhydantoinase A